MAYMKDLATRIDEFSRDWDPYGYMDNEYEPGTVKQSIQDMLEHNPLELAWRLREMAEEDDGEEGKRACALADEIETVTHAYDEARETSPYPIDPIDLILDTPLADEWADTKVAMRRDIDTAMRASGSHARIENILDDGTWAEVSTLFGEWPNTCGYRVRDNNGRMDLIVCDTDEAASAICALMLSR